MKKLTFILLILFGIQTSTSQEQKLQKFTKISHYFLGLEVNHEFPISEKVIVDFGIGFGSGNYIKNTILNSKEFGYSLSTKSFPSISFRSGLKYFYNREKRSLSKKNISNNSGNYFASRLLFFTKQNHTNANTDNPPNNIFMTEGFWGMRRTLGGNWFLDIFGGLGFAKDFDTKLSKLYPVLGIKFSYIIF